MKTITFVLFLALLIGTGCATRYDMTLTNGMVITTKGKPRLDEKKHVFFFTDMSGQTNAISEFRVTQVAPQSMTQDDTPKKFNPVVKK